MMTRKPFLIVLPFVIALIAVLVLLLALGGVAVAQEPEQTGNHSVRSLVNHGPQPGILEDNISTRASTEENAMAETEAAQSPFGGVLQVSALGDLEVCPVSRLEAAFSGIPQKGGQPLAFSYYQGSVHVFPSFIGDDPTHCQHYQGMARKDVEGTPYLFFTRSGNETVSCPGKGYWPGELLIVRMGSKSNVNGESLGSNCVSLDNGKCEPADGDRTQKSIHFNPWTEPAPGGITHPGWMHLGGVQLVGDVLVVPVEKRCDCFRDNGQCGVYEDNECKKPDSDDGALVLYDVSDPENPQLLKEIRTYGGYPWPTFPGIGVVAATKNPWGNNYLFMVGGADFDGEKKYWFLESNTDDLKNPNLMLTRIGVWNSDEVGRGACQEDPWMKWQMLNFVRDTTGTLYLIGTDNSTDLPGGDDWVRLFRVERVGNEFTLTCKGERHLYSDESTHHDDVGDMGDFDAVGGVYVSPSGRLNLYMGPHDNNWWAVFVGYDTCSGDADDDRCHALQFGEFASTYYHDGIPPITSHDLSGTLGKNGWYTSSVEITLSANDTCGSGVQLTQYKIDSDPDWQPYSNPFTVSGDRVHTVHYRSQDIAGNAGITKTASVPIDTTPPTDCSILLNNGSQTTYSSLVRVSPSASDATSGVWQMRLRDEGGSWDNWRSYSSSYLWQLPSPTTGEDYTVEIQFKDWAGNTSSIYHDSIELDIYPRRPESSGYWLGKSTLGMCGTSATSVGYRLQGTMGQPSMIGQLESTKYRLSSGFWAVQPSRPMTRVYLPLVLKNWP